MSRLYRNSLSIFFLVLFAAALIGQALTGWAQFNDQQTAQNLAEISLGRYLSSADFAVDVTENWQSEYLQFLLYILATVFFVQRGSPRWAKAGGLKTSVYAWSLGLVIGAIFLGSWLAQSIAGWAAFNETRMQDLQDPISWGAYLVNPDFWARTLQNWQSEFLAVGSMAVFAIYLRQRGSAESKPVGEPHESTGSTSI